MSLYCFTMDDSVLIFIWCSPCVGSRDCWTLLLRARSAQVATVGCYTDDSTLMMRAATADPERQETAELKSPSSGWSLPTVTGCVRPRALMRGWWQVCWHHGQWRSSHGHWPSLALATTHALPVSTLSRTQHQGKASSAGSHQHRRLERFLGKSCWQWMA